MSISEYLQQHTSLLITWSIVIVSILILYIAFQRFIKGLYKGKGIKKIIKGRYRKFLVPSLIFLCAVIINISVELISIEYLHNIIARINNLLFIVSITWGLILMVKILKDVILLNYDIDSEDNLKARKVYTQFRIIERIIIFILIIIAVGVALISFESIRNLGYSLFASAGIAGIVIGLAAQRVIGSVLAGIQIAITQPIRIDDVVIVENEWGWIEEITLTYVVMRIWDKRRLIVPSTYFIEKPFQNWTRVSADILGTVFIYTDYTVPFNALRDELTRLLEKSDLWDGNVNVLQVTNAKEQTLEVRALVSAKDSPTAWNLRVYLREKLIEFLKENYPESLPHSRIIIREQNTSK